MNRSLLAGFYALMVYLAITIASVHPIDIFFPNHTLTLPVLRIDLDITYFFTFAPLVVLGIHVNLLVNLAHHRNKLEAYIIEDPEASPLYYHPFLYNFIRKSSLITDASQKYNFATTNFLRVFIWSSLVILPLFVLIFLQVRFLPAQNFWVNFSLVGVVFLDAFFLWRFRRAISTRAYTHSDPNPEATAEATTAEALSSPTQAASPAGAIISLLPAPLARIVTRILNSVLQWLKPVMVVTTPLLSLSLFLSASSTPGKSDRYHFDLQDMVLAESQSDARGILGSAPKLETAWAELAMADKVEDQSIRHAVFDRSIFTRISFRGSDLSESSFQYTRFEYGNFQDVIAANTNFSGANIRVGLFYRTDMSNANFENARLGVVDFDSATLHNARFWNTTLYGASFKDADLSGAVFYESKLAGADFQNADLTGADFTNCDLRGASFAGANLRGAIFTLDTLFGADFTRAQMQGTLVNNCFTEGASFMYTSMEGAIIPNLRQACVAWRVYNPDKVWLKIYSRETPPVVIDTAFYRDVLAEKVQVSPQTAILTPAESFFQRMSNLQPDCPAPALRSFVERFDREDFREAFRAAFCGTPFAECEKTIGKLLPDFVRRNFGDDLCDCP
ncbi:MAG: pentapeptide repeat-containing protein [Bacteroidota bacterium]